ncbi:hypothetical protein C1893_04865 [Pseudomonas sp. MPR-ANC1]|nr:hypothetical protein C1893_04865 [Pseudomonas sp. MPR-ANC1]
MLSTEGFISSFQALLSTDLSGTYSQGLIHRKSMNHLFRAQKNRHPLLDSEQKTQKQTMECCQRPIVRGRNRG